MKTDVIINRDALYALRELPSESVNCCVTSPPYYGLRDYGLDAQIGREDTPEQYIGRLVEVFRELRRVLKDDGTFWLNIADTYCGSGMKTGCKQKDLIGIPWLLAFAAGAMLYVVVEELIPEAHLGEGHMGTVGVMLGFLLMMILDVALG